MVALPGDVVTIVTVVGGALGLPGVLLQADTVEILVSVDGAAVPHVAFP